VDSQVDALVRTGPNVHRRVCDNDWYRSLQVEVLTLRTGSSPTGSQANGLIRWRHPSLPLSAWRRCPRLHGRGLHRGVAWGAHNNHRWKRSAPRPGYVTAFTHGNDWPWNQQTVL